MENWAIIIGINQYELLPIEKHLKFAVKDAEKMKEFLCTRAGFTPKKVLLCSDNSQPEKSISTRPTYANLRRILREDLPNHIQSDHKIDTIWFFFAGHGFNKNHQDYLLPKDGNPNDQDTAIKIRFVVDCLRSCKAQNIILVLDMCRGNQLEGSRGIGKDTAEITHKQGIITIFSCRPGATSYEIAELEQGAFTYTLLNGLQQNTILKDLEKYLRQEVPEVNRKFNKPAQEPYIILEPAWRYELPLVPICTTATDINNFILLAQNAELKGELEKARNLWWSIRGASQSDEITQEAETAIKRIQKKLIFIKPLKYLQNIWNYKQGKLLLLAIITLFIVIFLRHPIFSYIYNIATTTSNIQQTPSVHPTIIQQTPSVRPTINDSLEKPLPKNYFTRGEQSLTKRYLINQEINPECQEPFEKKNEGMQAFADQQFRLAEKNFQDAINSFKKAHLKCSVDPETLIFLNNAKANKQGNPITIAVVVPINDSEQFNKLSEQILRGVAHVQNKINQNNGIQQRLLQVIIARDDNKADKGKQVAKHLGDNNIPGDTSFKGEVLGVVGHVTSDVTLPSGKVYETEGLVAVSPVSTAVRQSSSSSSGYKFDLSPYVFRTAPSDSVAAENLFKYSQTILGSGQAAIIYSSEQLYSISLKEAFERKFDSQQVISCDLSVLSVDTCIRRSTNAKFRMLDLGSGKATDILLANEHNQSKLPLLGGDALYSDDKLPSDFGNRSENMVLAVAFHAQVFSKSFKEESQELWGTEYVGWRTAST